MRGGSSVLLGEDERGIFIQALGHIRAADCFPLREEVFPLLEGSDSPPTVFADLSACDYMDSTFIGLLVSLDGRLRAGGGRLHVLNPSTECEGSLLRLDLERILFIEREAMKPPSDMRDVTGYEKPDAGFVLKVHEALMEKSEEARSKFSLLKKTLEKKIRDTPSK